MKEPIILTKPPCYMSGKTMVLVNLMHQERTNTNKYSLDQVINAGVLQWHLQFYNARTILSDQLTEEQIKQAPESTE
jgi:hypothetical protein